MMSVPYVYWRDGKHWLGYIAEFPDYLTQGESLGELMDHLKDLYRDLKGGVSFRLVPSLGQGIYR